MKKICNEIPYNFSMIREICIANGRQMFYNQMYESRAATESFVKLDNRDGGMDAAGAVKKLERTSRMPEKKNSTKP